MKATEIIDSITALAWPVLIAFLIWKLLPEIKNIAQKRGFAIKVGGAEINVQQASDQLADRLEEVREQVSILKQQVTSIPGIGEPAQSPLAAGLARLRRILWVDDYPENNAYEIKTLKGHDVEVDLVKSTAEALEKINRSKPPYDAIITDMGRADDGGEFAGADFVGTLVDLGVGTPVFVYASAQAVANAKDRIDVLHARKENISMTSSSTEMLELLALVGCDKPQK